MLSPARSENPNPENDDSSSGQLSLGAPIPANLADHNWVNAEYEGTEGLCCLGATSPTGKYTTVRIVFVCAF